MHYQQWLQTFAPVSLFTNEEILNGSPMPDGWFNPYTISQDQIDSMRQSFRGGALKWSQFVEANLPNLDSKLERKLKKAIETEKRIKNCGKIGTRMGKDGLPHNFRHKCHRYESCLSCRIEREKEHFERLVELDGCQVVFNDRKNMVATYGADVKTYSFKLADGRQVTVIDSEDEIPGAIEMNYELAKELKSIHVTGTKISGKLGKEKKPVVQAEEQTTLFVTSHIIEASQEVKDQIEQEFYEQTKDLQPASVQDLRRILIYLNQLWLDIVTKYCEEIHLLNKHIITINENDLDWTKRREHIDKWLKNSKRMKLVNMESTR